MEVQVHRLLFSILVHTIRQMPNKVSDAQRQNNILDYSNHTYSSSFPNLYVPIYPQSSQGMGKAAYTPLSLEPTCGITLGVVVVVHYLLGSTEISGDPRAWFFS